MSTSKVVNSVHRNAWGKIRCRRPPKVFAPPRFCWHAVCQPQMGDTETEKTNETDKRCDTSSTKRPRTTQYATAELAWGSPAHSAVALRAALSSARHNTLARKNAWHVKYSRRLSAPFYEID